MPTGKQEPMPSPTAGEEVRDTEGVPQLSIAVGVIQLAIAQLVVVLSLILAGQLVRVGGVSSLPQGLPQLVG